MKLSDFSFWGKIIQKNIEAHLKLGLYRLSEDLAELFQINHTQPLLIHIIKEHVYFFLGDLSNFVYPCCEFVDNNEPMVIDIDLFEKVFIGPAVYPHSLFEFEEDFPCLWIREFVVRKCLLIFETLSGDR